MNTLHREHGRVVSVSENPLGSELLADTANGATLLAVEDAVDFNPTGGWLLINSQVIEYDTADYTADTLTLLSPLAISANAGDRVDSYSLDAQSAFTRRVASVDPDDAEGSADTIDAVVPHALFDRLAAKIRDEGGESVEIEETSPGQWRVVDVVAQQPSADGAYVWNPHAFRDITDQNVVDTFWARINSWTTGEADGIDMGGAASTTYTVQYPGVYFIAVQVAFLSNANGVRRVRLMLNDTQQVAYNSTSADGTSSTYVFTSRELRLVEQDTISVDVWQNSGATLPLNVAGSASTFAMHRVSV